MKRLILAVIFCIALISGAKAQITHNVVAGTNSISIDGVRYPLNVLVLQINKDSVNVAIWNGNLYLSGYGDPICRMDSFLHYKNAGTKFTSVSQIDSFYQAKFVK